MKSWQDQGLAALRELLAHIPSLRVVRIDQDADGGELGANVRVTVEARGRPHLLVCEFKSGGQPRQVRDALLRLRLVAEQSEQAIPVLITPYLSAQSQALCVAHKVGFLDLEENCRLGFDDVFIERSVPTKPPAERRRFKSPFRPRSAQVLRAMLRLRTHVRPSVRAGHPLFGPTLT